MDRGKPNVDEIFLTALEKVTAEDRSKYLDEACVDDTELRKRVERLLRAQPMAGAFLESPAPGIATTIYHQSRNSSERRSVPTSSNKRLVKVALAWSTWPNSPRPFSAESR